MYESPPRPPLEPQRNRPCTSPDFHKEWLCLETCLAIVIRGVNIGVDGYLWMLRQHYFVLFLSVFCFVKLVERTTLGITSNGGLRTSPAKLFQTLVLHLPKPVISSRLWTVVVNPKISWKKIFKYYELAIFELQNLYTTPLPSTPPAPSPLAGNSTMLTSSEGISTARRGGASMLGEWLRGLRVTSK